MHAAAALLSSFKQGVDSHVAGPAPRALIEIQTQLKVGGASTRAADAGTLLLPQRSKGM
jgi:hypothetical protein